MVLCYVVVQQGCSGNIAHQSGIIAAQKSTSQNTHTTERKKGMVLCKFYLKLESCPLPSPLPKGQALPLGSLPLWEGGGGMGGGIALPLAKVENLAKNTKTKQCTEFALSTDTNNECQKKFRMSIAMEVIQYCFNTGGSTVSVLEQYWCQYCVSTGSEVYHKCISSVSVVYHQCIISASVVYQ